MDSFDTEGGSAETANTTGRDMYHLVPIEGKHTVCTICTAKHNHSHETFSVTVLIFIRYINIQKRNVNTFQPFGLNVSTELRTLLFAKKKKGLSGILHLILFR